MCPLPDAISVLAACTISGLTPGASSKMISILAWCSPWSATPVSGESPVIKYPGISSSRVCWHSIPPIRGARCLSYLVRISCQSTSLTCLNVGAVVTTMEGDIFNKKASAISEATKVFPGPLHDLTAVRGLSKTDLIISSCLDQ